MFLHAYDIMRSKKQMPAFNIKIVLDTEEEKGSSGLKSALQKDKEQFVADYLIVMDGPMHSSNMPTLTFGNRGGAGFTLTTYGALTQQHSGHYGNYSPDPSFLLSKIIASMKDGQGRVLIDGFYDGIMLDEETKKILAAVPDNKKEINERLVIAEEEKVGMNYQESLQYPSLTIQGMRAAVVGKGSGSIIPEEAVAVFGIRLVPETDGSRMIALVKKHIEKLGYTVLDHSPGKEERLKYAQIVFFSGRAGSPAFRTEVGRKGNLIDASGMTVIPGLFDMHTHQHDALGEQMGRLWLSYGITSIREPGTDPYDAIERRRHGPAAAENVPGLLLRACTWHSV